KTNRYEWPIVVGLLLATAAIATLPFLTKPGVIGGRHDWVLPAQNLRGYLTSGSSAWSGANLGESKFFFPTYLLDLIFGLVGYLGVTGALVSKVLVFGAPLIAGLTLYSFARRLGSNPGAAFAGALLYATAPILYDKIVAGHLGYLIAYAIAPLYLAELVLLEQKPSRQTLAKAILIFVAASVQIQFAAMLMGFALIFALLGPNRRQVFRLIGWSILALLAVHAPWLAAHLGTITAQARELAGDAAVLQWIQSLSSPLASTIRLASAVLPYFLNQVKDFAFWQLASGLLYAVLIVSPGLVKSRLASFFALTALLGVFLAKGTSAPFTSFYVELFLKLPATSLFREVNHWLFIPAISYAVLLAYLTHDLMARAKQFGLAVLAAVLALTVVIGLPFWHGRLGQDLQTITYSAPDQALAGFLKKQTGRILFLPAYQKNRYPQKQFAGFDPFIQEFADRTFEQEGNVLAKTSPASRMRNLILAKVYGGDQTGLAALLARANVDYVVVRRQIADEFVANTLAKDFGNREVSFDLAIAEENLQSAGLTLVATFGQSKVYRAPESSSRFYLTQAPIPQQPEPLLTVEPADYANRFFDPTKGFVKSYYLWWYNRQFVNIEDRAVHTQTNARLTLPFKVTTPGILYVRALVDPKGGDVAVSLDHKQIATLNLTGPPKAGWQWFELGLASHAETISLERLNGEVTVGKIALFKNKIDTRVTPPTLEDLVLRDYQPLGYQIEDSSKYRLSVSTDRPRYLVFAESYSPGWVARVDGMVAPHERIGFGNGFLIEEPGTHDVEISFTPERYYRLGLALAGFTLVLLVFASIKRKH
ncbi:hypothetical protein HYZ64_03080, partial [Candidatus Berkelbacteria bacterium]|nr:hypothetical protein [Candidatus Berkelbacteria bacterium]